MAQGPRSDKKKAPFLGVILSNVATWLVASFCAKCQLTLRAATLGFALDPQVALGSTGQSFRIVYPFSPLAARKAKDSQRKPRAMGGGFASLRQACGLWPVGQATHCSWFGLWLSLAFCAARDEKRQSMRNDWPVEPKATWGRVRNPIVAARRPRRHLEQKVATRHVATLDKMTPREGAFFCRIRGP